MQPLPTYFVLNIAVVTTLRRTDRISYSGRTHPIQYVRRQQVLEVLTQTYDHVRPQLYFSSFIVAVLVVGQYQPPGDLCVKNRSQRKHVSRRVCRRCLSVLWCKLRAINIAFIVAKLRTRVSCDCNPTVTLFAVLRSSWHTRRSPLATSSFV